jgi:cold shock protein
LSLYFPASTHLPNNTVSVQYFKDNQFNQKEYSMAEGTIKKLTDKGFGFIKTDGDKDLFFHSSALLDVSFDELQEGQKVSYTEGRGKKGPCAENVKPI